eukprot:4688789-Pleurochrysis_carterae.AAC.1
MRSLAVAATLALHGANVEAFKLGPAVCQGKTLVEPRDSAWRSSAPNMQADPTDNPFLTFINSLQDTHIDDQYVIYSALQRILRCGLPYELSLFALPSLRLALWHRRVSNITQISCYVDTWPSSPLPHNMRGPFYMQESLQTSPAAKLKQGLAKLQAGDYDETAVKAQLDSLIKTNACIMFSFTT